MHEVLEWLCSKHTDGAEHVAAILEHVARHGTAGPAAQGAAPAQRSLQRAATVRLRDAIVFGFLMQRHGSGSQVKQSSPGHKPLRSVADTQLACEEHLLVPSHGTGSFVGPDDTQSGILERLPESNHWANGMSAAASINTIVMCSSLCQLPCVAIRLSVMARGKTVKLQLQLLGQPGAS